MAISKIVYKANASATPVTWMDATPATAAASDIIATKTAMLADGVLTTGTGSGGGSISLQDKTVTPTSSDQVVTYDTEYEYLVEKDPGTMTPANNYWQLPITWNVAPEIGETYHVYFYWDRWGKGHVFAFDDDVVWNGYGSTTFVARYGTQSATITINQNNASSNKAFSSDDDPGTYSATLNITRPASYDGLNSVTVKGKFGYTLLFQTEVTVNTTSTTETSVTTLNIGNIWTKDKIIYVRVYDKAGKRMGYFYGSDTYFMNYNAANSSTSALSANVLHNSYAYNSSGAWAQYASAYGYGVYANSISSGGSLYIYRRYNSTYSLTINGTYVVEVYALDWPNGISPYNAEVAQS